MKKVKGVGKHSAIKLLHGNHFHNHTRKKVQRMSQFKGCETCRYDGKEPNEYPCNNCIHGAEEYYEPKTNANRIREMSDEELAKFLEKVESCGYKDSSITTFENGQYMDMLEWLQTEVKEGNSDENT